MKRTILFRGRTKAGKWLEGMPTFNFEYIFNEEEVDSPDNYEVEPETVGEFTGLTDKNGVKIFEGDIISPNMKAFRYFVVFENGCFVLYHRNRKDHDGKYFKWGLLSRAFELSDFHLEVVGNIHNNPKRNSHEPNRKM